MRSIPTAYWPPFYYYYLLSRGISVEVLETYQKRSLRNKCNILSAQGLKTLTVPLVKGKHESQMITSVAISYDENWQKQHISTITTCYSKAPYFIYYFNKIESLINQDYVNLHDLNSNIHKWVLSTFFECGNIKSSSTFNKTNFKLLSELYQSYPIIYNTVYDTSTIGKLDVMSILDIIFNVGPEISFYLEDVRNRLNSVYFYK